MSAERITWTDVRRAAINLADAWHNAGGATPPGLDDPWFGTERAALAVDPGSVTNGITAGLRWMPSPARLDDWPIPGGARLARSARDSYDMLCERAAALRSLAAAQRIHTDPDHDNPKD